MAKPQVAARVERDYSSYLCVTFVLPGLSETSDYSSNLCVTIILTWAAAWVEWELVYDEAPIAARVERDYSSYLFVTIVLTWAAVRVEWELVTIVLT